MQEVVRDNYKTDQEKKNNCQTYFFKEEIISKGIELNIELMAA